jgi:hypothetical protein
MVTSEQMRRLEQLEAQARVAEFERQRDGPEFRAWAAEFAARARDQHTLTSPENPDVRRSPLPSPVERHLPGIVCLTITGKHAGMKLGSMRPQPSQTGLGRRSSRRLLSNTTFYIIQGCFGG